MVEPLALLALLVILDFAELHNQCVAQASLKLYAYVVVVNGLESHLVKPKRLVLNCVVMCVTR
jgi:hypothetical protein